MKYTVRVDPTKLESVKSQLRAIGVTIVAVAFDYLTVDIPTQSDTIKTRIESIPGIIAPIKVERTYRIGLVESPAPPILPSPLPAPSKIQEFYRLFLSNPITGPIEAFSYSLACDIGRDRIPTSISRKMVGADIAEAEGITGKGIRVAIIDTGVDAGLRQRPGIISKSTLDGEPYPVDNNGHGTWCLSCAVGKSLWTPFGEVKGVAPDADVLMVKCLGAVIGIGTTSAILRAMMDAFEWKADIISMSLGSEYTDEPTEEIPECRSVKLLTESGVIVVISNGNSGPGEYSVGVPANSPYALSVGAVDINGNIADFSSRGPTAEGLVKPDVVGPGVDILSSTAGGSLIDAMQFMDLPALAMLSGTSMACPHVSGLVALALQYARSKGKTLTTDRIKEACDLFGDYAGSKNNDMGWGLLTYQLLKRYIDEKL